MKHDEVVGELFVDLLREFTLAKEKKLESDRFANFNFIINLIF